MRGKQRRRQKAARVAADPATAVAVAEPGDPAPTEADANANAGDHEDASAPIDEPSLVMSEDDTSAKVDGNPAPADEGSTEALHQVVSADGAEADEGTDARDDQDTLVEDDNVEVTDAVANDQDASGEVTQDAASAKGDEPSTSLAFEEDTDPAVTGQVEEAPRDGDSAMTSTAHGLLNEAMGLDLDSDEAYIPLPPPTNRPGGLPVQPLTAITAPVPVVNPTDALFTPGPSEARPGAAFAKIELPGVNKDQDPLALLALGTPAPTLTAPAPVLTDAVAPPKSRALPTDAPVGADMPSVDAERVGGYEPAAPALEVPVDLEPTGVPIILPRVGDGAEAEDLGSGTLTPAPMPPVDAADAADPDGRRGRRWTRPLVAVVSLALLGGGAGAYWLLDQDPTPTQEQIAAAPADLPAVGSGERLGHLQEGSRLLTAAVRGEITNRFQVPATLDDPFVAQALGEPLNSYLSVNEWVPDPAEYQFRLCLTHSSGGWLLYDSLYGGIVDLAANGTACPAND